jgi:hypothetical protein
VILLTGKRSIKNGEAPSATRTDDALGAAAEWYLTVRCANPTCARLIAFQKSVDPGNRPDLRIAVAGKPCVVCPHCKAATRFRRDQIERRQPADSWMGQSVGRWEGDTLVIDVTGLNDQTWFDRAGNFHSDKLHVVERYTRTSPDVMSYEATIEDPITFTRPWKISMPLYRRQEKNAQLLDFKCVEFVEECCTGSTGNIR